MFVKTLDSKNTYINEDLVELRDLGQTIFKTLLSGNVVFSYYRVPKNMEMRPDKLSNAVYGEDTYTEMIMKYSFIDNPFAIMEGDIIAVPALNSIYTDVKDLYVDGDNPDKTYAFVRNYHKYIDKSKLPDRNGSSGTKAFTTSNENGLNLLLPETATTRLDDFEYQSLGIRNSYGNIMGYGSNYNDSETGNGNYLNGQNNNSINSGSSSSNLNNTGNLSSSNASSNNTSGKSADSITRISSLDGTTPSSSIYGIAGNNNYLKGGISNMDITFDDYDEDTGLPTLYDENGNIVYSPTNNDEDVVSNIDEGPVEANLANNNKSGINLVNGRIYFGDSNVSVNPNDVSDVDGTNKVDSPFVDCARAGVSLGQFINATIKNNVKK